MKTRATGKAAGRKGWLVARLDEIEPVACPCGMSRRAFVDPANTAATLHLVDISEDARAHYHEKLTEIYYVLEGEGHIELDGEMVPVRPGSAVMIFPGTRHRAVGKLKVLNIPVPPFDPEDEHFDG
jgi:mannose-6-phosphate isomerase-like protein (cupin superfamily)